MATTTRLKILCLHGFTSNGQVHAHQLRRITKALPEYDFLFPDGPHTVNIQSQMDMEKPANQAWSDMVNEISTAGHRAWWFARDGNWSNNGGFHGLEDSLDFISKYIQDQGPVHAIWGFSQGACFAGMLCALLQEKLSNHPLRKHFPSSRPITTPMAGVIFSGFKARFPQYDGLYEQGLDMPMLHVIGEQDPIVQSERSQALIQACQNSEILMHAGGHDIPKASEDQARIIDFIRANAPSSGGYQAQASM